MMLKLKNLDKHLVLLRRFGMPANEDKELHRPG